jgi:hypothetical protein
LLSKDVLAKIVLLKNWLHNVMHKRKAIQMRIGFSDVLNFPLGIASSENPVDAKIKLSALCQLFNAA